MRQFLKSSFLVFCFVTVKIEFSFASTYTQTIYDTKEARQVSTYSQVIREVSKLECGIACSDNTCLSAGYNLNTRICYVSDDDVNLATSTAENHWIVLTKQIVLPGQAQTVEAQNGNVGKFCINGSYHDFNCLLDLFSLTISTIY